ncbi:uncharacterized protein LOC112056076 isoform X2 [Bicyclus anynana]|uniref:Uncharacterized protein LOC112056076 isoform X2 n=1 Tax=Bicyclus anynana TaxID=110368 RepID=A0ABM3M2S1_BICAN|nr:uncharacterized protein LOC112056076 isoform X2 [Bicyclus anynana]
MTSTNDGKDVKSNQTSGQKGKTYFIELYKSLELRLNGDCSGEERTRLVCEAWGLEHTLCRHSTPTTQTHLLFWLQQHTAHTILQTEWQAPTSEEHHKWLEEAINAFIHQCREAASKRGGAFLPWELQLITRARWFLTVLPNPWENPVLKALLDADGPQPKDQEVLQWLIEEHGVVYMSRLRQLAATKRCVDLALLLATAVLNRARYSARIVADVIQAEEPKDKPEVLRQERTFQSLLSKEAGFTQEIWDFITDIEFVLHYKSERARCIDLAKLTPLRSGYQLVARLQKRLESSPQLDKKLWKNAKDVAIIIAQVVVARCMVVPSCVGVGKEALFQCVYSLAQLLPADRLPAAAATLAAPAASSRHLHTLALAVHAQCKEERLPFVCSLYVRAITAGMNELEKLKLDTEKQSEARATEMTLSKWFNQLGSLLAASSRLSWECALTAFSVHPSKAMYEQVMRAPPMAPLIMPDVQEQEPNTSSEFGSWATDSRTQTNLVKTSETLKLKQTQKQANVLSTAIFAEGEGLGLGADLCQDLAVLLSGPRVKTLYWDLDREVLLENCRTYMERTHSGTRALTTELKYLNLDPSSFQHLPEEEDEDENNVYYGIEKGYEHLVEFEEPEPEDIMCNEILTDYSDTTESPSSMIEVPMIIPKRKKKKSKPQIPVDDEVDPLSLGTDTLMENNERPQSSEKIKHKSKERSKSNVKVDHYKEHNESNGISDEITNEIKIRAKKKEKKERKNKEQVSISDIKIKEQNSQFPTNLSTFVGTKVVRPTMFEHENRKTDSNGNNNMSITDSDYDSQGKSSINSEYNDNVRNDSPYSIGDHKAPGKILTDCEQRTSFPPFSYLPNTNPSLVKDEVKKGIQKLIEYRRHKVLNEKSVSFPSPKNQSPDCSINRDSLIDKNICNTKLYSVSNPKGLNESSNISAVNIERNSSGITQWKDTQTPSFKERHQIKKSQPKAFNPEHPSLLLNHAVNKLPVETPSQKEYQQFLLQRKWDSIQKRNITESQNQIQFQDSLNKQYLQETVLPRNQLYNSDKTQDLSKKLNIQQTNTNESSSQTQYHNFLKELQDTINAGTIKDVTHARSSMNASTKKIIPPKKVDNAANTYSRLSYMHKNKQCDNKLKPANNRVTQKTPLVNVVREQIQHIKNLDLEKVANLQLSGEIVIAKVEKPKSKCTDKNTKVVVQKIENFSSGHLSYSPLNTTILSNMLTSDKNKSDYRELGNEIKVAKPSSIQPTSRLSEKDQFDILSLLKQQNKLKMPITSEHTKKSSTEIFSSATHRADTENLHVNLQNKIPILLESEKIKSCPTTVIKATNNKYVNNGPESKMDRVKGSKQKPSPLAESDWKSVMDDLLAHKTPSRGPNALDIVLNKDSFEKRPSNNLNYPTVITSLKNSNNANIDTIANHSTQDSYAKASTSTRHLHNLKTTANIKQNQYLAQCQSKISSVELKKAPLHINKHLPSVIQNSNDPFISGIPNSDYDLLEELMDDDLRQEIGELSSDDETYRTSNISTFKPKNILDTKEYNLLTNKPNIVINKVNTVAARSPSNFNSVINSESLKNSHETMNSIIDKSVTPKNNCLLRSTNPKNPSFHSTVDLKIISNKITDGATHVKKTPLSGKLVKNTSASTMEANGPNNSNLYADPISHHKKSIIKTSKLKTQNTKKDVCSNLNISKAMDNIKSNKMHNVSGASKTASSANPAKVVLTVPQRNTSQNVMLIGSNLIYDSLPMNQSTNSGNLSDLNGHTYVAVNQAPINVALLHASPLVGPALSPVIIESSVTLPVIKKSTPTFSLNLTSVNSDKNCKCENRHARDKKTEIIKTKLKERKCYNDNLEQSKFKVTCSRSKEAGMDILTATANTITIGSSQTSVFNSTKREVSNIYENSSYTQKLINLNIKADEDANLDTPCAINEWTPNVDIKTYEAAKADNPCSINERIPNLDTKTDGDAEADKPYSINECSRNDRNPSFDTKTGGDAKPDIPCSINEWAPNLDIKTDEDVKADTSCSRNDRNPNFDTNTGGDAKADKPRSIKERTPKLDTKTDGDAKAHKPCCINEMTPNLDIKTDHDAKPDKPWPINYRIPNLDTKTGGDVKLDKPCSINDRSPNLGTNADGHAKADKPCSINERSPNLDTNIDDDAEADKSCSINERSPNLDTKTDEDAKTYKPCSKDESIIINSLLDETILQTSKKKTDGLKDTEMINSKRILKNNSNRCHDNTIALPYTLIKTSMLNETNANENEETERKENKFKNTEDQNYRRSTRSRKKIANETDLYQEKIMNKIIKVNPCTDTTSTQLVQESRNVNEEVNNKCNKPNLTTSDENTKINEHINQNIEILEKPNNTDHSSNDKKVKKSYQDPKLSNDSITDTNAIKRNNEINILKCNTDTILSHQNLCNDNSKKGLTGSAKENNENQITNANKYPHLPKDRNIVSAAKFPPDKQMSFSEDLIKNGSESKDTYSVGMKLTESADIIVVDTDDEIKAVIPNTIKSSVNSYKNKHPIIGHMNTSKPHITRNSDELGINKKPLVINNYTPHEQKTTKSTVKESDELAKNVSVAHKQKVSYTVDDDNKDKDNRMLLTRKTSIEAKNKDEEVLGIKKPEINMGGKSKNFITSSIVNNINSLQKENLADGKLSKEECNRQKSHLGKKSCMVNDPDYSGAKITFEELPYAGNDPLKKCVRIKLPNGNIFKATISGKIDISVDSILKDPTIQSLLLKNNQKIKCTLQINQYNMKNKKNILNTEVKNISCSKPDELPPPITTETIDLISDDEEDIIPQKFKTEFGIFNTPSLDQNIHTKHQNKLSQKCVVLLGRCTLPQEFMPIDLPNNSSSVPVIYEVPSVNLAPTLQKTATDYIEIDESSNDSVSVISSVTNTNDINKVKVDELKNLLLKELGVDIQSQNLNLTNEIDKNIQEVHRNTSFTQIVDLTDEIDKTFEDGTVPAQQTERKAKQCLLKIKKCDDLVKKMKINIQKCYVNLVRCDESIQGFANKGNLSAKNMVIKESTDASQRSEDSAMLQETNEQLKRSDSISILNDLDDCTVYPLPLFEPMSPSLINDFVIPLNIINSTNISAELEKCDADWFITKSGINKCNNSFLCHVPRNTLNKVKECEKDEDTLTDCESDLDVSFSVSDSFQVPSLFTLTMNFLFDSDIIYGLMYSDLTSRNVTNSSSLKRKSTETEESGRERKISKNKNNFSSKNACPETLPQILETTLPLSTLEQGKTNGNSVIKTEMKEYHNKTNNLNEDTKTIIMQRKEISLSQAAKNILECASEIEQPVIQTIKLNLDVGHRFSNISENSTITKENTLFNKNNLERYDKLSESVKFVTRGTSSVDVSENATADNSGLNVIKQTTNVSLSDNKKTIRSPRQDSAIHLDSSVDNNVEQTSTVYNSNAQTNNTTKKGKTAITVTKIPANDSMTIMDIKRNNNYVLECDENSNQSTETELDHSINRKIRADELRTDLPNPEISEDEKLTDDLKETKIIDIHSSENLILPQTKLIIPNTESILQSDSCSHSTELDHKSHTFTEEAISKPALVTTACNIQFDLLDSNEVIPDVKINDVLKSTQQDQLLANNANEVGVYDDIIDKNNKNMLKPDKPIQLQLTLQDSTDETTHIECIKDIESNAKGTGTTILNGTDGNNIKLEQSMSLSNLNLSCETNVPEDELFNNILFKNNEEKESRVLQVQSDLVLNFKDDANLPESDTITKISTQPKYVPTELEENENVRDNLKISNKSSNTAVLNLKEDTNLPEHESICQMSIKSKYISNVLEENVNVKNNSKISELFSDTIDLKSKENANLLESQSICKMSTQTKYVPNVLEENENVTDNSKMSNQSSDNTDLNLKEDAKLPESRTICTMSTQPNEYVPNVIEKNVNVTENLKICNRSIQQFDKTARPLNDLKPMLIKKEKAKENGENAGEILQLPEKNRNIESEMTYLKTCINNDSDMNKNDLKMEESFTCNKANIDNGKVSYLTCSLKESEDTLSNTSELIKNENACILFENKIIATEIIAKELNEYESLNNLEELPINNVKIKYANNSDADNLDNQEKNPGNKIDAEAEVVQKNENCDGIINNIHSETDKYRNIHETSAISVCTKNKEILTSLYDTRNLVAEINVTKHLQLLHLNQHIEINENSSLECGKVIETNLSVEPDQYYPNVNTKLDLQKVDVEENIENKLGVVFDKTREKFELQATSQVDKINTPCSIPTMVEGIINSSNEEPKINDHIDFLQYSTNPSDKCPSDKIVNVQCSKLEKEINCNLIPHDLIRNNYTDVEDPETFGKKDEIIYQSNDCTIPEVSNKQHNKTHNLSASVFLKEQSVDCVLESINDIFQANTGNEYSDTTVQLEKILNECTSNVTGEKVASSTDNDKNVTLVYKGDSNVILKGSIYEDSVIGTCYVFPVIDKSLLSQDLNHSNICDSKTIRVIESLKSKAKKQALEDSEERHGLEDVHNIENFNVLLPKLTYSRQRVKSDSIINVGDKRNRKTLKRKYNSHDGKLHAKRYRNGKNIDYPKFSVTTMLESAYSKEYKRLMDYCTSIKFSYSRPFHKDYIDVPDIVKSWPIKEKYVNETDGTDFEYALFAEEQFENKAPLDPLQHTLAEEISQFNEQHYTSCDINENNFSMGFGERSDRVIQISEDKNIFSKDSAATLSDVKHSQPFLTLDDYVDCDKNQLMSHKHQMEILKRSVSYIQLRDKVRSFFKKTTEELNYNWLMDNMKNEYKNSYNNNSYFRGFPYDLINADFIEPAPIEAIVQVVQVGQLPVSAAAQNPMTCDPRVTQVTDASPQCSIENSPHDDSHSPIKTEYTELTTADLSMPLVHEYDRMESQASKVPTSHHEDIPVETEITSIVKTEITVELSPLKEEPIDYNDGDDLQALVNKHINNVDYSFDSNENSILETQSNRDISYETLENNEADFSPHVKQNGSSEKTDQIAHAMNAAGITTTETMINTDTHDLVDMLSHKDCQAPVANNAATGNNYTKSPINAMTLQQALAQILPPPLNQTNIHENNQTNATSSAVTSQVLHIVQGKNTNGNQITLVDNTQNSVISNSNTPVLHIVQNKGASTNSTSNANSGSHTNSYSGLSLVDAGQGSNQLLHIVNTGNQKNNAAGQLIKRVNLLTNIQGSNEQKMVQFVCKSADGKSIHLNAPHQRSMVLRLQPIESPNVQVNNAKTTESQDNVNTSPTSHISSSSNKDLTNAQNEIKSRSVYEENYAKFIQNSSGKPVEKSTSLPKFGQAFGKQVFQDGNQKGNDVNHSNHSNNSNSEISECQPNDNSVNLDHIGHINSPPLLLRKSPSSAQTQPSQANLVQQIKQSIGPMNIQTMHGGVIYTRQIPVNIGGGQTINLITVPSTELIDDNNQKQKGDLKFVGQSELDSPIIKIVPQNQSTPNAEGSHDDNGNQTGLPSENAQPAPHQPVLTQMRIKLPMLSKTPQMVSGARVVRPSFFQIQRNVIGGANQHVYQQLVLTAAPSLGQHTIRLPQTQANRQTTKTPTDGQSPSEPQMSSSTLEQLREFDMVLEQVKERSTVQPNSNSNTNFTKLLTPTTDTTDGSIPTSTATESTQQVLYSIGSDQSLNVAYINRKTVAAATPTTSAFVRSPDSSGIIDSPSSSHAQIPHTVTSESTLNEATAQPATKSKVGSKSKPRTKTSNPPHQMKIGIPPKPTLKPQEDEQTTQRILYILAEYKEQVENSPDKDKPAPRRRTNPPTNPGSSKRKKSSSSRRSGTREMSPVDDSCRTMGSEDSSCGTSQGDCNESCRDSHSPQDSPRKVARKLTFENETSPAPQPKPQPQRNVIVADGQTITVARGTAGKPTTAVLMPANYILPVSMVKGGQQIAIMTNRGPKLLTVAGGEGGANALLLQRLIGPGGLKPMLTRPGVRQLRLPTAALHNLQAFNLTTATTVQPPDSTASPAPASTPPELVETRARSSPWTDREQDVKPERDNSSEGSEPWNLHATADPHDYSYEETVRTDNMNRTVLVVHKRDGSSQRHHRLTHVSAAALRHKYAILEHELRLQKSLSEECEDLGVDSPSASELFPEAELLFSSSPAHEAAQHSHTPQPTILNQSGIPQPDIDDQIATDELLQQEVHEEQQEELDVTTLGLDEGIVTVNEDGQATIALDQEEFARSHPNTTFHSEPTDEGEIQQPFTITGLKGRHITSTIFHAGRAPATVLVTAPQATVISQANPDNTVQNKYINQIINHSGTVTHQNLNLSSVLVKDDRLTKFDNVLTDSRELHLSNTASAIIHSTGNATQVIRRVCYEDDKRDPRFLMDEPEGLIAGDDAKMVAEDSSRDATLESIAGDDENSLPERHTELFWESNSASERSESRRPMDFSSDSEKCCKSPSFDEANSTDSSGVGTHMRLDSVIKNARGMERSCSADGSSADDTHPPLRTYPAKRMYHVLDADAERSVSGKTRAGERSYSSEVRRRASGRGVVKRGCHCCSGSPAPPRPKKSRQKKPTMDFTN